jgi:hypothetical protein
VKPVRVAPGAVFPPLDALRVLPLVLIRKEVAAFALGALENDFVSGHGYVLSYQLSAINGAREPQGSRAITSDSG